MACPYCQHCQTLQIAPVKTARKTVNCGWCHLEVEDFDHIKKCRVGKETKESRRARIEELKLEQQFKNAGKALLGLISD